MILAKDQLPEESNYSHLAKFLQNGGTLEVGEDFSTGAFARLRRRNRIVVVDTTYRDLAAILRTMNSLAKDHFECEV